MKSPFEQLWFFFVTFIMSILTTCILDRFNSCRITFILIMTSPCKHQNLIVALENRLTNGIMESEIASYLSKRPARIDPML
jgi:hypothetical protein